MRPPFERSVRDAVGRGVDFLLQQQDADGFWREFDLQPGASESWTTAWVGWCLTQSIGSGSTQRVRIRESCGRAAASIWNARQSGGWGYNRRTGPDADTTSWVLRFFEAYGSRIDPTPFLIPHIDAGGGVHTFLDLDFGGWTHSHDDVAANAGLALLPDPAAQSLVARIQRRLTWSFPGQTYWWSTPTYGIAWTLRFLRACGGFLVIHDRARSWISSLPSSDSAFEVAHRLLATGQTRRCACESVTLVNQLLDLGGHDGWSGGSFLLVPSRHGGSPTGPKPELRALLTTGICVAILSDWVRELTRS